MPWDETLQFAQRLEQEGGIDILNTGIGWHEARVPTIATCVPRGAFTFTTKALKEANVVDIPLVTTNRINDPQTAETMLQGNYQGADMVSMARPLLADPDFVKKAFNQRAKEINTCIGCNQACLDHAFVGKTASCLVNPRAGHESLLEKPLPLPESQRLNIGVVGAGPAGCSFALAAAQLGHNVTLYDRQEAIGGQFHMAKRIPGKEEFHETLRYFDTMLSLHNVNRQLGTNITHEEMAAMEMDKWVVATGVTPRDPQIPGMEDHPDKVLSYIDVLLHNKPVGNRVAIVGAGGIGFDVGEFLLHQDHADRKHGDVSIEEFWKEWGIDPDQHSPGGLAPPKDAPPTRQITLMQRKKGKLGANLGKTTGWIHRATLQKGSVKMLDGVSYDKIDGDGNLHITRNGKQEILEVDTIVLCAGQIEHKELETQAQEGSSSAPDLASKVYTIGGAYKAGELDAKRAIDMGFRLALQIHRPEVVPGRHVFQSRPSSEEKLIALMKRYT